MTGIRSRSVPISAFAGRVIMAQLLMRSPVFLSVRSSHKPAITMWLSSAIPTEYGCFCGFFHSYNPSVMTRQRWPFFQASRNAGAVPTVSARALIEEKPTLMSLAHQGTRPQRIC